MQIVNPAFAFSFDKYRRAGKDVVMYGETPGTLAGDVACTSDFLGSTLFSVERYRIAHNKQLILFQCCLAGVTDYRMRGSHNSSVP